jgi:two-component system osmolarity sensor histidine kinase EnvZ
MVGSSVILLTVAIMFLRNQIRPILRLAEAADAFGKGRPEPPDFRPRGAREVRQAAQAFLEMRERITTHVDQRTTMLAGVSHDLRTILTRFKLQLALLDDTPEANSLRVDVDEMQHMLEDYLAFARGHGGEEARPIMLKTLLDEILDEASVTGVDVQLKMRRRSKGVTLPLKRHAFKRAISNLVSNATRFGETVIIRAATERRWLRIEVDDDGPGIPPEERDAVFQPFYRLDVARNQNKGNSGLGLAIARDIARSHGGDITLGESSMGGLRAIISVPL